jgi:tRNA(fMet)-specific endonuclease VapC
MSLYILDTDHFTLYRYGHETVTQRVVTIEEQLTGWYTQVRKARNAEKLTRAYAGLFQVTEAIRRTQVLPFTAEAVARYLELRKQLPRVGKLDLAIAAIVLEMKGTVVTRNRNDFKQVPNLQIDDWTVPTP